MRFANGSCPILQLEGDTVMMAPASGFYATPGAGSDEVRIAYVLEEDAIRRAVASDCCSAGSVPGPCLTFDHDSGL